MWVKVGLIPGCLSAIVLSITLRLRNTYWAELRMDEGWLNEGLALCISFIL